MKKFILALAALLMIPLSIMPANALSTTEAQQSSDLLAALELAATLPRTVFAQEFGANILAGIAPESHTERYPDLAEKINELSTYFLSIKQSHDIERDLTPKLATLIHLSKLSAHKENFIGPQPPNKTKQEYQQALINFGQVVIEKITRNKYLKTFKSDQYFKISPTITNAVDFEIIPDIYALLWLQYIVEFDNEPVQMKLGNKTQSLPPLRWAYFIAHAGAKDFKKDSEIFKTYSKQIIDTMFQKINTLCSEANDTISKEINSSKRLNAPINTPVVTKKLEQIYAILLQKNQIKDDFFKLYPEFKDAYPEISQLTSTDLPPKLAQLLSDIAHIWLNLIKNNILIDTEPIKLAHPLIMENKQLVGITATNWAHFTASAGYTTLTTNTIYAQKTATDSRLKRAYTATMHTLATMGTATWNTVKHFVKEEEDDEDSQIIQ